MAVLELQPAATGTVRRLRDVAASIRVWNDARVTRKALHGLSTHELADIGLMRGDIAMGALTRR